MRDKRQNGTKISFIDILCIRDNYGRHSKLVNKNNITVTERGHVCTMHVKHFK